MGAPASDAAFGVYGLAPVLAFEGIGGKACRPAYGHCPALAAWRVAIDVVDAEVKEKGVAADFRQTDFMAVGEAPCASIEDVRNLYLRSCHGVNDTPMHL